MITEPAKQKGETIRGIFHLPVNTCSRCGVQDAGRYYQTMSSPTSNE